MNSSSKLRTDAEIALAKAMYAEAKAAGALKPPRALAAMAGRSGGAHMSVSASNVTWHDYLIEARAKLGPPRK